MDRSTPSALDDLALAMARWLDAAHAHALQPGSGADALEEAQRLLANHVEGLGQPGARRRGWWRWRLG